MRTLLILWASPLVLFWGWYFVSLNDWNMGYLLLTREAHDLIFQVYCDMLAEVTQTYLGEAVRLDPKALPGLLARTFVVDSCLLFGLIALRKRKQLAPRLGRLARLAAARFLPRDRMQPVEHALQDEGGGGRVDAGPALGARNVHREQAAFGGYRG